MTAERRESTHRFEVAGELRLRTARIAPRTASAPRLSAHRVTPELFRAARILTSLDNRLPRTVTSPTVGPCGESWMKGILAASLCAVPLLTIAAPTVDGQTETYTGCLNRMGLITKVARGDAPDRPCRLGEEEIQLAGPGAPSGGGEISFFERLSVGEDKTIAASGPLRLVARCAGTRRAPSAFLFVRSTQDGWYFARANGPVSERLLSGNSRDVCSFSGAGPGPSYASCASSSSGANLETGGGQSALSETGHFIDLDVDEIALGSKLPGTNCIVRGRASVGSG